ncbi:hypothetical protein [Kitasatospora sp. NPDC057015]|uniref:hypothetical protein n=1 Tax=Kitasatospora sp. NPDC057015 TaxID=3346001 RepID=UPI003642882B
MREKTGLPYDTVFTTVYAGLRVNLCLLVAGLPVVVAFTVTASPLAAWPFLTGVSALCGPAVTAAFAAFEAFDDDPQRTGRAFWTAYRTGFTRSLGIAAAAAAGVVVLVVDLRLAAGTAFGAVTPMLVLLIALVVTVTTTVLAAGRQLPARALLAAAYLSVRAWHLALVNLAVLGVLLAVIAVKPAVGLLLLPAPALYLVWVNTRHTLAPLTAGRPRRAGPRT